VPINKLFVEGTLDVQVLNPVFQGSPVLKLGGPKYGLRTRCSPTAVKIKCWQGICVTAISISILRWT
jgi:hypothetical protein